MIFDNAWVLENLKPNTYYTISTEIVYKELPGEGYTFSNKNIGFDLYSSSNRIKMQTDLESEPEVEQSIDFAMSFQTPADLTGYVLRAYAARYQDANGTGSLPKVLFEEFQLEEGESASAYEPYKGQTANIYLDAPLRKVGDYADYIDFDSQQVIRRVKLNEGKDDTGKCTIEESYTGLEEGQEEREALTMPEITLNEGTSIIKVNTTVAPSKIEIWKNSSSN